ncbi:MAG: F0F1 ATP synthase subunit epsilon [Methylocystaceae bacterium]|nr:MAG: F0F1 ATP synthase subunit epsilon [Methylocystaceae bacterium]
MTDLLRLTIATPSTLLVDAADVSSVRAEDESGSFGILPGHADLLTVLPASVVRWRAASGDGFCALRGGVLTVTGGARVAIACRQAILGETLETLESAVRAMRATQLDTVRRARVEQTRLHTRAVRQLMRYLHPRIGPGAVLLEDEEAS